MDDVEYYQELKLLELSEEVPEFGKALLSAEFLLEQEKYNKVLDTFRDITSKQHEYLQNPASASFYYLVHFYMGQALFRREMEKEYKKAKRIDKSIDYLSKAIELNSRFIDSFMMRGLVFIVKAQLCESGLTWLEKAKQDFRRVLQEGNSSQKDFAAGKIDFIDSQINFL